MDLQTRRQQRLLFASLVSCSCALALAGVSSSSAGHALLQRDRQLEVSKASTKSDSKTSGMDGTSLELLRFVTPYGTGMEAVTDITPYAPLLQAFMDSSGGVPVYGHIDTWVNNDTSYNLLYVNNITHNCSQFKASHGNGWKMNVDLLVWPDKSQMTQIKTESSKTSEKSSKKTEKSDSLLDKFKDWVGLSFAQASSEHGAYGKNDAAVKPRETVVLAQGYPDSVFPFGTISVHEGSMRFKEEGAEIMLKQAEDMSGAASDPPIFRCSEGAEAFKRSAFMGYIQRKGEILASRMDSLKSNYPGKNADQIIASVKEDFVQTLAAPRFVRATTVEEPSLTKGKDLKLKLGGKASLKPGMPVYYASGTAVTPQLLHDKVWWNLSYPFEPVGRVKKLVDNETFIAEMFKPACFDELTLKQTTPLMVPPSPTMVAKVTAQVDAALQRGMLLASEGSNSKGDKTAFLRSTEQGSDAIQFLDFPADEDNSTQLVAVSRKPIGWIRRDAGGKAEASLVSIRGHSKQASGRDNRDDSKVCAVRQLRHGGLFARDFKASLSEGERALLQLSITGHGWAATTEQCGEYCHAVYHLRVNGQSAANVTQWRSDCKKNPMGRRQHGTWFESRNGWCPGSVEPGTFIDVTRFIKPSPGMKQNVELEVTVWSNVTQRYEPYTDVAGFVEGDAAMLVVAMNVMLYGKDAVASALAKDMAFTPAEAALRQGSNDPRELSPPATPVWDNDEVKDSPKDKKGKAAVEYASSSIDKQHFNIEGRAPWFFYNESAQGAPGAADGAVVIPALKGAIIQATSRYVNGVIDAQAIKDAKVGAPETWRQVALRFSLEKPYEKLEFDHWDRIGSFGLEIPKGAQLPGVQVVKGTSPKLSSLWSMTPVEVKE